jgi:hypothetical protein
MKVIGVEIFNLSVSKNTICCAVLDCTYLELIRLDAKIPRLPISNKKIKGNKKNSQRKETSFLIIGVTKPDGAFLEVRATIDMLSPLDAKGSLTIYPPDLTLVQVNSKIELLRYDIFSKEP